MSILDLGYDDPDTFIEDVNGMMPMVDSVITDLGLADNSAVQSIRDGISPHIVLGLTNDHLDAIFATGLRFMQSGDAAKAQVVFTKLVTFKAIDYRFWYALGTALQTQDHPAEAARAYLYALGLEATDVDTYLRLGECLLSAGELENARDTFQMAVALCVDGHGQDDQRQAAESLIAHTNQRIHPDHSDTNNLSSKGN